MPLPFVSVIVPCRNEARHIQTCVRSILAATYPADRFEVLVVDGLSTDGTRDILQALQRTEPRVRMLTNERLTAPCAMNLGIRAAAGDILVRMDAHAAYPPEFIALCVSHLKATGADVVGGPIETVAGSDSLMGRSIALVTSHPFGVGNSKFRTLRQSADVDTVPFGAYRREIIEKVGPFNEALVRNQDNELCSRIRTAGGRIFMTPDLTARYYCQSTWRGLLTQAFRTGMWNVATLRMNPRAFRLRHFAPGAWVLSVILASPAAALVGLPWIAGAIPLALHAAVAVGVSAGLALRNGARYGLTLLWLFESYHLAYGSGTIAGIGRTLATRWPAGTPSAASPTLQTTAAPAKERVNRA